MIEPAENSAVKHHRPLSKTRGRLHYASDSVGLFGRDKEFERLRDFCDSNKPLSWWVVAGGEGTGKSKLCYEFSKDREHEGWTICTPSDNSLENLLACSEHLPNDTLFVFDYREQDLYFIVNWISALNKNRFLGFPGFPDIKIRILLIQQSLESSEEPPGIRLAEITHDVANLKKLLYDTSPLILLPLPEASLRELMRDYSAKRASKKRALDAPAEDFILKKLHGIDGKPDLFKPALLRPLYALILTDAYLAIPDLKEIKRWDITSVLDCVCEQEIDHIRRSITSSCKPHKELHEIACALIASATIVGGINLDKEFETFLKEYSDKLAGFGFSIERTFKENECLFDMTDEGAFCPPLEPNIIGEFFVLKTLNGMKKVERTKLVEAAWFKTSETAHFSRRLFRDFSRLTNDKRFSDSLSLFQNITLPASLTSIKDNAFYNCSNLVSVRIPDSVTSIKGCTFYGCANLISVGIPDSLISIDHAAFYGCTSLASVDIPNSVTSIGNYAFSKCSSLTFIDIPNSVRTIKDGAFLRCSNLEVVSIPASVRSIGNHVFHHCPHLSRFLIHENLRQNARRGLKPYNKVKIVEIRF
jgi:hypothetical protein